MKNKNGRRWRIKLAREKAAAAAAADRLSELPDDLLLNILERVDTIDAVKTCILCKQMLKLPGMLSQYSIDIGSMPTSSLGAVIRANRAVAHKVDAAEFEIITDKAYRNSSPADRVHSGRQFNAFLGACPDAFAGLTRLWLCNMRFGELDIPNILSAYLHLDFRSEKIWVLPERRNLLVPVLGKLRHTDKEYRRANGYCEKEDMEWKSLASNFKHRNLVKLTIYGFQPDANFLRFIRRVAEVVVKLAEISLHDRKACGEDCGDLDPKIEVCPSRYPRTAEERKKTIEELGLASPAIVHFLS
ncbi:unnamed protein product [Alopecurus aequalis]